MEERRQLLLKISKQLETMSEFISGIEKSLHIMVPIDVLEPQFRHVLTGLKQTFEVIDKFHKESQIPKADNEAQENSKMKRMEENIEHLGKQIQKLKKENERLKSATEQASKKKG